MPHYDSLLAKKVLLSAEKMHADEVAVLPEHQPCERDECQARN